MDSVIGFINNSNRILKMSKEKKEFEVGDLIIPLIAGIMELGDPPFEITEINEGSYTCIQQIGSEINEGSYTCIQQIGTYKSTLVLKSGRMRHI